MKNRRLIIIFVATLVATLVVGAVFAAGVPPRRDFTEAPQTGQSQSEYLIVTFKDPPAASYTGGIPGLERTKPERGKRFDPNSQAAQAYLRHLENEHANYRSWLASNAPRAEIVREFSIVLNGVAIRLNGERANNLQQGPGVDRAGFSDLYRPAMNVSVDLIGASALWPEAGGRANAGAGIKVGVIDSGIDDTHRFFACKSDIPHKVYASGVAFDPDNVLVFDHGTHVAGTIGGCVIELTEGAITGDISGVAPGTELWDYNVFPGFGAGFIAFGGSAFSHDIAAALEDTVRDGMHVVNMSLGGSVEGPHDFLAEAVNATVDAGLVVAVAAGNSGPGDATITSPGSAAGALTAGASTNPHFVGISVEGTTADSTPFSFGAALGDFNNFDPPITADYTVTVPADGCAAISNAVSGKIALIDRGVCTFTTKIRNAQDAGAIGVLVANNVAGDPVAMGHDGTDPFPTIPAAMVSKDDGAAMKPSGTVTVDGTVIQEFKNTGNEDIIAGFSSRGPTPFTYLIKPDVTAPGVNVVSSVFNQEFAFFQGTSMATPHLAGSAALLLDLNPNWSPADVKSALVNTAKRPVWDHITGTNPVGVLARGGGRVDLTAAPDVPVTIDPASASFGLWTGNQPVSASLDLTVRNVSSSVQTCSVNVEDDPDAPDIVTFSGAITGLAAGDTTTITLHLEAGRTADTPSGDYDADVVIDCDGAGTPLLQVPWWVRIDRSRP